MKVPFNANNHNSASKTVASDNNSSNTTNNSGSLAASSYEPKSVLDIGRSPSPVGEKPAGHLHQLEKEASEEGRVEEDHALNINQHYLEDWDSLMRELGLNDDPTPQGSTKPFPDHQALSSQDHHHHQHQHQLTTVDFSHATVVSSFDSADNFNLLSDLPASYAALDQTPLTGEFGSGWNVGFDYVDELIRLAECFETSSLQFGQVILARLNQRLTAPSGKPLQRAAFYFKEALQSILTGSPSSSLSALSGSSDSIVQTIKAQKTFSTVSPIPMFSSFTANQAVLEALENGFSHVHVVDFDIGLGGHWASFIKELAESSARASPPSVRVSALVPQDYTVQSRLVRENLTQFARELNIRFDIEFVLIQTFEYLSFKSMKFIEGEKVIVLLSPSIFHHIGTGFLNDLRHVSPHVVVHVDYCHMGIGPTTSYRQTVIDGLEYYSTLLESLEAGTNFNSGGDNWVKRIEMLVVYPKIVEVVASGRRVAAAREALVAAGLRQVGLSQFAEFQAECLVRRVQVRGFRVVKRQGEMLLCWHDRPLVAASAWAY